MPDKPKFPLWVKSGRSRRKKMVRQCEQSVAAYLFVHMMFAEEAQRYPGNDRNQR
jgi:hypothetical protein